MDLWMILWLLRDATMDVTTTMKTVTPLEFAL
jgi:hypothetical protein